MKNPITFLTFSSLSLSVCLLSQYLTSFSSTEFFCSLFGEFAGHTVRAVFFGVSRLSQLFYGIFAATFSESEKSANLYFFGFSQLLFLLAHSLIFDSQALIFALFFAAQTVFFVAVSAIFSSGKRIFAIPQLAVTIFLVLLCVTAVVK